MHFCSRKAFKKITESTYSTAHLIGFLIFFNIQPQNGSFFAKSVTTSFFQMNSFFLLGVKYVIYF